VRKSLLTALAILILVRVAGAMDFEQQHAQPGDIDVAVTLDPSEQSGNARATMRIHARRELVWELITSCPEAMGMIPGLVACNVLETAADQSWQRIRHVMNYSWYVPTVTYEIRATYQKPAHVTIERISGDLRVLRGSWDLQSDGEFTVARYALDLAPGFWVPRWVVHAALRRDLPKMLRSLRSRAEETQAAQH
jgi:hypothetical protein